MWALSGGFALIVPMIIMSLNSSQVKSLVTTSVATSAVAAVVSWWIPIRIPEALSIVAAYAAVLVVFVGTGTQT